MVKKQTDRLEHIQRVVKNAPASPGVYKMTDKDGKIIYVGKAKKLRLRLQSYFRESSKLSPRKQKLVEKVCDISYSVVDSELEALILETNLIKEHLPKYNVLMKDDKNYVYIRISIQDDYPRISLTRKRKQDGALYIGPKTAGYKVKSRLKILKRLFPYRHCRLTINDFPGTKDGVAVGNKVIKYPCLDYHIKRCDGPCIGGISKIGYRKNIDAVVEILRGNYGPAEAKIKEDIVKCVSEKKFEQAAKLRDQLLIVTATEETQKISDAVFFDLDVLNFVKEIDAYFFNLFQVREGKIVTQSNFIIKFEEDDDISESKVLQNFLTQYYLDKDEIPEQILLPIPPESPELVTEFLAGIRTKKVKLKVPDRGKNDELLKLALKNAKSYSRQMRVKWLSDQKYDPLHMIADLKSILNLAKLPKRIECYDISHLGGTDTVGSMIVFENGMNKNKDHRHFQIRSLPEKGKDAKPDDFKSMQEVLSRRLKYLAKLPKDFRISQPTVKQFEEFDFKEEKTQCFIISKKAKKKIIVGWGEITLNETDDKQAKLTYTHKDKRIKLDSLLVPLISYCFKKWKIQKLNLEKSIFIGSEIDYWDLGVQESRKAEDNLVLERHRFSFSDGSLSRKPNLIIIDGGKGQLSSALKAFKKFAIEGIEIVSLAKKQETIFFPKESVGIVMPEGKSSTYLVKQVRDEAHRFAISYNRKRRLKRFTESQLDAIPGVGPKMKIRLLQHFDSVEAISKTTEAELKKLTTDKVASLIIKSLS